MLVDATEIQNSANELIWNDVWTKQRIGRTSPVTLCSTVCVCVPGVVVCCCRYYNTLCPQNFWLKTRPGPEKLGPIRLKCGPARPGLAPPASTRPGRVLGFVKAKFHYASWFGASSKLVRAEIWSVI